MEVQTTRFGTIEVNDEDLIRFDDGLPSFPECQHWVILADGRNPAIVWLQSVQQPEVAFAVVSPRRYLRDFRLRVARRELEPIEIKDPRAARVLCIVGRNERGVTLNLKAPLIINLERRVGRQVIANGDLPVQYELRSTVTARKRIA
jgi:flagellar assembly factor FliW